MTHEPWQDEPWQAAPEPVRVLDPTRAHIYRMIDTLRALGILKPREAVHIGHKHDCSAPRAGACTCPGGPNVVWADFDELKPVRHYCVPERFYDH